MNCLIERSEEEGALLHADNTCARGKGCVSPTVNAGTAFAGPLCIMCLRMEVTERFNRLYDEGVHVDNPPPINPYVNVGGDYPDEYLLDITDPGVYKGVSGPFVRYDPSHYVRVGENGVRQNIPVTPPGSNWFSRLIDVGQSVAVPDPRWFIVACPNGNCSRDIFTLIDQQSATGVDHVVYNLDSGRVECVDCHHPTETIYSGGPCNMVLHRGKHYSRCVFCLNILPLNLLASPQVCGTCTKENQVRAMELNRTCSHCGVVVNVGRRKGGKCVPGADGPKYLCKQHLKKY